MEQKRWTVTWLHEIFSKISLQKYKICIFYTCHVYIIVIISVFLSSYAEIPPSKAVLPSYYQMATPIGNSNGVSVYLEP